MKPKTWPGLSLYQTDFGFCLPRNKEKINVNRIVIVAKISKKDKKMFWVLGGQLIFQEIRNDYLLPPFNQTNDIEHPPSIY